MNINYEKAIDSIKKFIPQEDVYIDELMREHTSFKIGGVADLFVKVRNVEQVHKVIEVCDEFDIPLTIIGNGSNLLVKDNGIRGIVVKNCIESYKIVDEDIIIVSAGMLNAKVSKVLLDNCLSGFEFAAGIPGTIGGAIKMNAGAYGSQMSDIVIATKFIDLNDNKIKELTNEEQEFGYRKSIFFKKNTVILETMLKLKKAQKEKIQMKIQENNNKRREKQPIDKPSAGSTFKRGNGFITAQLIDECNLKGLTIGGAQVSTKHTGFIVNTGNATAKDVIELSQMVKQKVYQKFNKEIELEIQIIGE